MESDLSVEEIVHREMNRIRGRLAGAIEACGLDERQERGAINTLKSLSYDSEAVIIDAINEAIEDAELPRYINGG